MANRDKSRDFQQARQPDAPAAPRFWVEEPLQPGGLVRLPERVQRHLQALRLREGDAITLFDGRGGEYAAVLERTGRNAAAQVLAHHAIERESPLHITLAQGISAGDRMDLTLQKATELGVSRIVPLRCERSVVRLDAERAARRHEHWRHILASACEQCGRNRLPELLEPVEVHAWLAGASATPDPSAPAGQRLMLDPRAIHSLAARLRRDGGPVVLLIGPEGGLAQHEAAAAQARGFDGVRLGPRILRTETAPLAALVLVQALAGDL